MRVLPLEAREIRHHDPKQHVASDRDEGDALAKRQHEPIILRPRVVTTSGGGGSIAGVAGHRDGGDRVIQDDFAHEREANHAATAARDDE